MMIGSNLDVFKLARKGGLKLYLGGWMSYECGLEWSEGGQR